MGNRESIQKYMYNVNVKNETKSKRVTQFQLISFNLQMEPLFPESCRNQAFVYDFYKDVIKRLMPERTLAQILGEAENVEDWRLNPTKVQEEYEEFLERTVAL